MGELNSYIYTMSPKLSNDIPGVTVKFHIKIEIEAVSFMNIYFVADQIHKIITTHSNFERLSRNHNFPYRESFLQS